MAERNGQTYNRSSTVEVIHGDCLDVLAGMAANTVDAIVTDPPYEIGFMGKGWDGSGIAYLVELWAECLRVLKPGGHLLAFGGTRTYHRMTCAIEDAGFEIRDSLHWLYGSGFPKSLDVSRAIDKAAGAEREVLGVGAAYCQHIADGKECPGHPTANRSLGGGPDKHTAATAPATDAALQWSGWGTALKPAHEPIVVARKPLTGTVAATVLTHGTGALNIDGCRVGSDLIQTNRYSAKGDMTSFHGSQSGNPYVSSEHTGRWPANLVLTHAADCEQVGEAEDTFGGGANATSGFVSGYESGDGFVGQSVTVPVWRCADGCPVAELDGQGDGASRFFTVTEWDPTADVPPFRYVAKASKRERNADGEVSNAHPTVKPVALMRWLVRLVTPPGGTVLDPFAGSGTTLVAATLEGFDAIGIEMTDDYLPIIAGRVAWAEAERAWQGRTPAEVYSEEARKKAAAKCKKAMD